MSDPALRTGSVGEETAAQVIADIPDEGFDLVIMNPPFTRATNHQGAHADVTNPAFAAFGATKADQTAMGRRINQSGRETCYHGNAGVSSAFAALANRKLSPGGILAMVLPLSAASGSIRPSFFQPDCYLSVLVEPRPSGPPNPSPSSTSEPCPTTSYPPPSRSSTSSGTKTSSPPTSPTLIPTAPSLIAASSATFSASTTPCTRLSEDSQPSGAPSRQSTAASRGREARGWLSSAI